MSQQEEMKTSLSLVIRRHLIFLNTLHKSWSLLIIVILIMITLSKFNCPEFTSLCPITGQPDFANIYISYIPDQLCVESKSLKLYLFSYRNHGDFHENCINTIGKDLVELLNPRYLEVWGKFTPRGGISIDPYYNYGRPETKYEKMAEQRLFNHDLYPENIDNR